MINKFISIKRNFLYSLDDFRRIIKSFSSENEIINEKEIRVVGLRRSGNHAIITWLRRHYQEYVWHLNNIPVKENPYRFLAEHFPKESLLKEAKGEFSKKICLIYNYENCVLENVVDLNFESKHDLYLGKSKNRYDLLILRDPFNMIASMYYGEWKTKRSLKYQKVTNSPKNIAEIWLDYAREYLGETNYLKNNKIIVSYNKWCSDQDYRKQISHQLNLEFSDTGFNVVKGNGGGSSFDGKQFDGNATQMDVMNRWKKLANDSEYRKMFNQEMYDYSERIFGHIPETETLLIN